MRIIIGLILVFMFFGAFFIVSNHNLNLNEKENRIEFARAYYSWLVDMAGSVKSVTGAAIRAEWVPDKEINNSKDNSDLSPMPN